MIVDLRSDTLTKPCSFMRKAMSEAEVGDDVFGEDPTVRELESYLANVTGHEAGLFCASGTQSNLVALLSHCQRGDEYIVGQNAHTYRYEAGGAAVLGSIQPQPLEHEPDGSLCLNKIKASIKADDFHFAKSRLLALENTIGGKVLSVSYLQRAKELAMSNNLQFHLDGARVFNAAVALNKPVLEITSLFDSVSICLSKGLGAPVGSVLVGTHDLIDEARRWRKMVGGGMRQAGVLAAAGLYALKNNVQTLKNDHERAKFLASSIRDLPGLNLRDGDAQTNMVFLEVDVDRSDLFSQACKEQGVLFTGRGVLRLVVHRDIDDEGIAHAASVLRSNASILL